MKSRAAYLCSLRLPPLTKLVALVLSTMGGEGSRVVASYAELAFAAGVSRSTVKRALVELESRGLIVRGPSTDAPGLPVNEYRLEAA